MNNVITYLNTDLDLTAADDLTTLAAAFAAGGLYTLHVTHGPDGRWYACFETRDSHAEPESNMAAMMAVIEALAPPLRAAWAGCSRREFNVGYDCGAGPWAFNQGLSAALLGRMAAAGASLRWTLYPDQRSTSNPAAVGE